MMKTSPWLWLLALTAGLAVAFLLSGHGAISLKTLVAARFPGVRWIDSATLSRWETRGPGERPTILDARTEAEFEVSHLQGSRRVDPDEAEIEALRIATDATVVVYCSVGYRSAVIAEQLQRAGISEVYNLEGGIFTWANEGRPVYRDNERVKTVHPYSKIWGRFLRRDLRAPLSKNE